MEAKSCCRCKEFDKTYSRDRTKADGYSVRCKDCDKHLYYERKLKPKKQINEKKCARCITIKDTAMFFRSQESSDGYKSVCKQFNKEETLNADVL